MKKNLYPLLFALLAYLPIACHVPAEENKQAIETSNLIKIDEGDSLEEIVRKSTLVVPTERQYDWQKLEFIAFLHFGVNTFTGVEWGSGKEGPSLFNSTALDANQWISVIHDAGMKLAMLTAKHHDGFCLWPTTTSSHSVKSSPWKNGEGDVLGDLVKAARKQDIEIGVYLSPADLHEIEREGGTYGNGSKPKSVTIPSDPELQKNAKQTFEYELDDYNALFMNQLYEVLTQYGKIKEVWFDGANPKPGTGQTYDRKTWYDMIRQLQPDAVIAIKGPDVRWCGNEAGNTRLNEWSVLPTPVHPDEYEWYDKTEEDLGSREKIKDAEYLYWYPAETNTSIRHGWFYRDEEQEVKTVDKILDTWYRSVGGNTVFLLNLTPDRRGLIPDKDANRLREVGEILKQTFDTNLIKGASAEASETEDDHSASNVLDGDENTFWKPEDGSEDAHIIISLPEKTAFNRLVLQEAIKSSGQRIEEFAIDIQKDGQWEEISKGTVIGYKNIRRFPMVQTDKVRIRILASRVCPTLSTIGLYKAPEMLSNPVIRRNAEGVVSISCQTPDPQIYYTLDGSAPDTQAMLYTDSFELPEGGNIKARAFTENGTRQSEIIEASFDISPAKWSIVTSSGSLENFPAKNAIDVNSRTLWQSEEKEAAPFITINLGEMLALKGFTYLPRQDGRVGGICSVYQMEVSADGQEWKVAKKGNFDNIKNDPTLRKIHFSQPIEAQYVRFTGLKSVSKETTISIAEIGILTR